MQQVGQWGLVCPTVSLPNGTVRWGKSPDCWVHLLRQAACLDVNWRSHLALASHG